MTADRRTATLVIQTAFLGDVVLTTPLLTVLAERHGPVDVVTTPGAAPLLEGHPAVREVIRYDKKGRDAGLGGLRRLGAELRARRYARVYLPHRSWRSAALAFLARVPQRTGFADSAAAITYTTRVPRARAGHEVERLLALGGGRGATPPVSVALSAEDEAAADRWLAEHGVPAGFVAVAPGSIWGTKRWPYYPALAASLEGPIVVIGGPEDAGLSAEVVAAAPARAWSAAGALSLRGSAALIRRARALVTNDSAPLHLATAVGTPVVAIFGPTVTEQGFGPRDRRSLALGHAGLRCRPCSAHGPEVCPLGHHRCMRELPAETVVEAVARVAEAEDRRAIRTRH
ncbi:MAG TPA: lipopolysaccharide heptosyltransferase II [Gemmatimonadales bacterium]|nr:lipopolysaccharide heptosyltransferase II [Gemmatimonadales bacterium]